MIHVIHLHADQMLNALTESAHVYLNTRVTHTLVVDRNVSSTMTAQETKHALEINVSILAREHVDKMLYVMSSTTFQCAIVLKA
jgi:hypothetical protein